MNNFLCESYKQAEQNRQLVKDKQGEEFYQQQDMLCEHWELLAPPPSELIVAEETGGRQKLDKTGWAW